jgi:hypothetical protein
MIHKGIRTVLLGQHVAQSRFTRHEDASLIFNGQLVRAPGFTSAVRAVHEVHVQVTWTRADCLQRRAIARGLHLVAVRIHALKNQRGLCSRDRRLLAAQHATVLQAGGACKRMAAASCCSL